MLKLHPELCVSGAMKCSVVRHCIAVQSILLCKNILYSGFIVAVFGCSKYVGLDEITFCNV